MNKLLRNIPLTVLRIGQKWFLILVLASLSYGAFSQDGSSIFTCNAPFDSTNTGKLAFAVDNFNFFKNNEYKSQYVDGYTLTGLWVRPKLIYYPNNKLRLEMGGQVLAYNGRDDYQLQPWFSAIYLPVVNLSFRMGNLDQDANHGLSEPMLDKEHFYKDKPERGIQAKINTRKLNADFWIDWQKLIFNGDPYKEQFAFGTVAKVTLYQKENFLLSMPIAFNGQHKGGEIDSAPGLAQTHIVVSEGIRYEYKSDGPLIKSGLLECSILQSTYPLQETALPGKSGHGFFIQTAMNTNFGCFATAFWQGNNFFSPMGMPLFQNGAVGQTDAVKLNRLWDFSYKYDRKIFEQGKFGFTSDLYYNPVTQKFSNSAAFYLMVNLSVLIRKKAN
jgi:hypothetical protein